MPPGPTATGAYVPEVDALRGLAMAAVVALHAGILPFGWMGVWGFYVISGFAVTTSWLGARDGAGTAALRGFYARRARRIWPVYFAYLGLASAWLAATGHRGWTADLPWLATFTFNLRMIAVPWGPPEGWSGFGHLWTLAVEQQFYLVLPLILLLPARRMAVGALVALALAAPAIRHLAAGAAIEAGWDSGRAAFAAYAFAPAHFDAFAAGSLIALARQADAVTGRRADLALAAALLVAVLHMAAFLALGLQRHGWGTEAMRNIVSGILQGDGREVTVYLLPVTATAAALLGILAGRRWVLLPCRLPGLQAMGRVSYGGYLFHLPVMLALGATFLEGPLGAAGRIALFLATMALTLPLAAASHRWFESRFLAPGRRAARVRAGAAAPA